MRVFKVLIANPSADVYGSDLQLLDSITGMVQRGMHVRVAVPERGRLTQMIEDRGASVQVIQAPVVRRSMLSTKGLATLALGTTRTLTRLRRYIKSERPDVVYVNTMTIPWWIAAARLAGVHTVCHVHEAENLDKKLVLKALTAPLMLTTAIITNSRAATEALTSTIASLNSKITLIYNGVPGPPPGTGTRAAQDGIFHAVAVCRLSPRKAPDVAMEAVAVLRRQGRNVRLSICGTPFAGYEWYEEELRSRAAQDDLFGAVSFLGYVTPVWPELADADVLLAPSLREPFGNAVVEAQMAYRPVVASAALGHLETVQDGVTGLLVPPGDAKAMAAAVVRLMDDPDLARDLATAGQSHADVHFNVTRYENDIVSLLEHLAGPSRTSDVAVPS